MRRSGALAAALLLVRPAAAIPACAAYGIGDAPQTLPARFVPAFLAAFGLDEPPDVAHATGTIRCRNGVLLVCTEGANLNCGRADRRTALPEADRWCARQADGTAIPAVVTGHATIYGWTCRAGRAAIAGQIAHVDDEGYVAEYWRPLARAQ